MPEELLEFNDPEDVFEVTGRGVAFSSGRWRLPESVWEPFDLRGKTVLLCGQEVKVLAVDAFAIMRSPENPYGLSFAILISTDDAKRAGYSK